MKADAQFESLKEIERRVFKFGTSMACDRFKDLPVVGRENDGGEPLFFETEEGIIYEFAQSERHELMIIAHCRRDGSEVKPHDLKLTFIETQYLSRKKENSKEE